LNCNAVLRSITNTHPHLLFVPTIIIIIIFDFIPRRPHPSFSIILTLTTVRYTVQEFNDVSTGLRFFCGYFKDLTLLKKHQAEMEERQALAQGMINASFDSMFEINERGIITLVNDSACSMFGYTRDEFLGSNISIICGGGEASNHDAHMKRYLDSGVKHIIGRKRQVVARRKDGSEFDVELGVQEVKLATTNKVAFCGFIRDLTEQKKDKRALRKQQQIIHDKFFGTADSNSSTEEGTTDGTQ
jgi:PAS domain S-box-containing protein